MTFPVLYDTLRRRRASPLLAGLEYYWKLDEVSGQRFDSVGGNHLSDPTSVGSEAGKQSLAASFVAASSQYLEGGASFVPTTKCTWAFWIKLASVGSSGGILTKCSYPSGMGWSIQFAGVGIQSLYLYLPNNASDAGTIARGINQNISAGIWYHCAFVFDGDGVSNVDKVLFYLNSTPLPLDFIGTVGASLLVNSIALRLGNWTTLNQPFDGAIDEVGIWSRVLMPTEIAALYNGGSSTTYPFS